LKQEDAIVTFLKEMNSMKIANPQSRVAIFKEIQHEQLALYDQRIKIIQELDISRPTHLTAAFVNQQEDKLKS
jgi:hypothetical protein